MTHLLTSSHRLPLFFAAALALLAGCAAPPVVAPPQPATIEAPAVAPGPSGTSGRAGNAYLWTDKLDSSAQRLRSRLSGNGVAVSQTTDLRLWVSLPADTAFAAGRAAVKAPATGWLDQVAMALRDLPRAEVEIVSDADGSGATKKSQVMALDRAASARDWLVIRGVPAQRITVAGRGSAAAKTSEPRLDILIGERSR